MGQNGDPPRWHIAEGIARHVVVLRGAELHVHARRCRTRRVHGIHAPASGMTCRELVAVEAARNLPVRAGDQGSPPLVANSVRTSWVVSPVPDSFTWRSWYLQYSNKRRPRNFSERFRSRPALAPVRTGRVYSRMSNFVRNFPNGKITLY